MAPRLRSPGFRVATPAPRVKAPATAGGKNAQHYQTPEHHAWAAAVKRRDFWTCQDCGATSADVDKDGKRIVLIADHIIEIEDGGARFDPANGLTRCLPCHNRKTAKERAKRALRV